MTAVGLPLPVPGPTVPVVMKFTKVPLRQDVAPLPVSHSGLLPLMYAALGESSRIAENAGMW